MSDYWRRLEMVRAATGHRTVKGFVASLEPDEAGRRKTLAGAAYYHRGDRDPKVGYLQQIARTYPAIDVEWLLASKPIFDPMWRTP